MDVGGEGQKKSFQVRLPPDILAIIDEGIKSGRWTSRSDFIYRSSLLFLFRDRITAEARDFFKEILFSDEYRQYIKEIIETENDRIKNNNHK